MVDHEKDRAGGYVCCWKESGKMRTGKVWLETPDRIARMYEEICGGME